MKYLFMLLIRFYQKFLSKLHIPCCRFYPTCSQYAYKAIETHGAVYGGWLSIKRICRCNPFSKGGSDPVPPKRISVRRK